MRDQKITRRELYELVWSMPMTKLAAEFSISDVGLKKTCERHRVPTPPRGYWAKIEAGQKPKQALFIEVQDVDLNQVKIGASTVPLPEPFRRIIEERKAERQSKTRQPREPAPSTFEPIVTAHPAVRRTVEALRRCKSIEASAHAAGDGLCGVAVGRGNIERAAFILDGMARLLADRGLHLEPTGNGMQVQAGPDVAVMVLGERTRTVDHIPTVDELNAEARREEQRQRHWQNPSRWPLPPYGRAYPEKDTVWSGQLFLQIEGYSDGVRRRWADGRNQRLECLIPSIVDGTELLLAARKAQREDREEQARQWEELRRRRELARLRQEREKSRTEFFNYLVKLQRDTNDLQVSLKDLALSASSIDCAQISRMMEWGEARLRELQGELHPEAIEKRLIEKKLFPVENEDELLDPLGEPDPPPRFW